MTRVISFEYLNRTLVWQEVSELLLFALPLVEGLRTRAALARLLPRLPDPRAVLSAAWLAPAPAPADAATSASLAQPRDEVEEGREHGGGEGARAGHALWET
jgi:peroxin-2